jgi:hypothetical protein
VAASVRIAAAQAATAPGVSTATATSRSVTATVRISDVSAQTASTVAAVRIGNVSASTGAVITTVRVADVVAISPAAVYVWDGSDWVLSAPDGTGLSRATATSFGSGSSTLSGSTTSLATARSTGSARVTFAGTVALSGGGTFSGSGGPPGSNGKFGSLNLSGNGTLTLSGSATSGPPGAGSVTVVPEPANSPPRILLNLTGFLGSTVTIQRIDSSGNRSPVRLANPGTLNAGSWVGYDYEAPFNRPVRYEATATLVVTSDPVTLTATRPWLIHPGVPALSQPVALTAPPTRTRETNQGVHSVLGRSTPIVITDGARRAPTFDLALHTDTLDAELALDTLLSDAAVLLLQITYPGVTRTDYWWVAVGSCTAAPMADFYHDDAEVAQWTLSCTVTDAPSGLLQSQRSWADLIAEEATWADVVADFATWRDVIIDQQIGS